MVMTNEKVAEACLQMARKVRSSNNDWALTPRGLDSARSPNGIDGLNVSSMEHALFMCAEIPKLMAADKREKAMRWLGYLQGALTALGVVTLEEAKKMNMPDAATTPRVYTAAGVRELAKSILLHPAKKMEIAEDMPTEHLRQKAVLWEDACSMEDAEHNATLLAEALEEWAIRTDNGEATFEAADPSRAAVSEDHEYEEKPGWLTPRRARAAATQLRRLPDCACGVAADDMPTPVLRSAYDAWNNCDTAVQEGRLAEVLAAMLEQWADAQERAPTEKPLTNDVTSEYWLSDDRVEVLWNSATPTSVTIHGMPVPIADLRRVLDHCEKLKEAL